jgi:hypothetical protein
MIKSTVDLRDNFGNVTQLMRRKSLQALEEAAEEGQRTAERQAVTAAGRRVSTFFTIHPHADGRDGFVSGIKHKNPLANIFDKGSLGKRTARLKNPGRRKTDWPVKRGANPYVAHRGDTTGEGVAPLSIYTKARAAGRRALLAALAR